VPFIIKEDSVSADTYTVHSILWNKICLWMSPTEVDIGSENNYLPFSLLLNGYRYLKFHYAENVQIVQNQPLELNVPKWILIQCIIRFLRVVVPWHPSACGEWAEQHCGWIVGGPRYGLVAAIHLYTLPNPIKKAKEFAKIFFS
jgi:hypothetical protein